MVVLAELMLAAFLDFLEKSQFALFQSIVDIGIIDIRNSNPLFICRNGDPFRLFGGIKLMRVLDEVVKVLSGPFILQNQEEVLVSLFELAHCEVLIVLSHEELGWSYLFLLLDDGRFVFIIVDENIGIPILLVEVNLKQIQILRYVQGALATRHHILNLNKRTVVHQLKLSELEIGLDDHRNIAIANSKRNIIIFSFRDGQTRNFMPQGVELTCFRVFENVQTDLTLTSFKHQNNSSVVAYFQLNYAMVQE